MTDSILLSTKRTLGLADDYDVFDQELILHINSVLGTLTQLGIGPENGYMIVDDSATWEELLGLGPDGLNPELRYNMVKSYVHLRIRLLWDPPAQAFVLASWQEQIKELEWRINIAREEIVHPYVEPLPGDDSGDDTLVVIDGGGP